MVWSRNDAEDLNLIGGRGRQYRCMPTLVRSSGKSSRNGFGKGGSPNVGQCNNARMGFRIWVVITVYG